MAKRTKDTASTTELEAAVLGVVWQDGPCTPYAIRQHFRESRAPRFSGSAGTIYPLVRRLEARGLVASKHGARGKRAKRDYRITSSGTAMFRQWLRVPPGPNDSALVHDPLRTRVLFLAALPRDEARLFVSNALDALRRELPQAMEACRTSAKDKRPFSHFAARNALLLTRARIRWLIETQKELGKPAQ